MIKSLRVFAISLCLLLAAGHAFAQAGFTFTPASGGCAPLVVSFTNTSGTGYNTSYQWNFGNSATSTLTNPSVSYTTPGTYTVTLTATGSSGTQTVSKSVVVYPPPVVSFNVTSVSGCAPLKATFSSTVTPNANGRVRYLWDFGDGYTDTSANPEHWYMTGGTYTVILTVTNGMNCTQTVIRSNIVTVYPKPAGGFTAQKTLICTIPAVANFLATSTGAAPLTYAWDYGDGTPAGSGPAPSHTYTSAGAYTVTLYTTDSRGCKDTLVKTSYIETQPNTASFSSPAMGCDSTSVVVKNTTPGNSGTEWLFGDGSPTVYGDSVVYHYTAPGTYTIRMVTGVGACSDTLRKQIVIHPKPVIHASNDTPCQAPTRVKFTGYSSIPGTTYTWAWADMNLGGTGDTISRPYYDNNYDTVTLIGVTPAGCRDTYRYEQVHIRDLLIEFDSVNGFDGCIPLTLNFGIFAATSLPCIPARSAPNPNCPYPFPVVAWTWEIDNVVVATTPRISHTFTTTGAHQVKITITTANGCTAERVFFIAAGDKVPPSFNVDKDTVCPSEIAQFFNTTPDTSMNFTWDYLPEFDSSNGLYHGSHKYKWPGWKTVTLYSSWNGCHDSLVKPNAVYVRTGNAQWAHTVECAPSKTVDFRDTSVGATSHIWFFGDGTPPVTTPSASHTYANYGRYHVAKVTYSSISGCRDTVMDSIRVLPLNLDIRALDTTLCLGDTLRLRPVWNTELPVWAWSMSINQFVYASPMPRPTTIMPHPIDTLSYHVGYDTVRFVMVTRGGACRDSVLKTNYIIRSQPRAGFSAGPLVGCMPLTVTFRDTSHYTPGTQPLSRWWSLGDRDTVLNNALTYSHYYDTAGIFDVKLRVTDWIGCKDSVAMRRMIDVRKPIADFNAGTQALCRWAPLTFNNLSFGSTLLKVQWYFGDGDSSNVHHGVHAYKDTGTYTVTLIVTDSTGCSDTLVRPNYISVTSPKASFTLSDTIAVCPPLTVQFTSTSSRASRYAWEFGNSGTATQANPASSYSRAGLYDVRHIAIDAAGCTDTAWAKVRVLGYAGALSYVAATGCAPLKIDFTSSIWNVPSLVWDFSDGVTVPATSTTTSHIYMTPGKYVPKLIFGDGKGCNSSSDGFDTIRVDGVEAAFKVVPPCEKTLLSFYDSSKTYFSPIVHSRWDFGSNGIMAGNPVTRTYNAPGEYPVTLISTNANGCKDTLITTFRIHPLPKIVATDDTGVCPPDMIRLGAAGGKTYAWTPATYLSCTACDSPAATPPGAMSWVVAGTDSLGCVNRDTVKVNLQVKSTFKVNGAGTICLGESYQLDAAGATLYSWTPAEDLDSPLSRSPIARPKTTTTYVVTGREGSCLADTHQVRVTVRPLPVVDAGGEQKVVAGRMIQLQASGTGIRTVSWDTDPSLSCHECFAPEATPRQTTTYRITAYNEFGCKATDSVRVLVLCDGSQLWLPNTFTPNGDGENDFFFPQGVGIDRLNYFRVYSRWGELLFEQLNMPINDVYRGWNGTHNGAKLGPDVYVYVLEGRCDTGELLKLKGDISLIR